MIAAKKGKQVRLLIYEDNEPLLTKAVETTGMSDTALLSFIVNAGLQAIRANDYRVTMPLKFRVSDGLETPVGSRGVKPTKEVK